VSNEPLWAPWRLGYVTGGAPAPQPTQRPLAWLPGADPACFICRAQADLQPSPEEADRENLVVLRSQQSIVILNRYPYNNGHLLIAPQLHKGRLDELTDHEQLDIARLTTELTGLLERLIKPDGFNVGLNLGQAAGAGLPGHLHWHVVPRWRGDTNFMSSVAGIRVIPQALDAMWELLHGAIKRASDE
jgi:ATP adenylyltransferase